MSAGQITAGKWTAVAPILVNGVEYIGVGVLGAQDAIALCGVCRDGDEPESIANAYLIASAPDLLAERDRLKAVNAELARDAERYRFLRAQPIEGAPGQPVIAMPNGMSSGYYLNEETADFAVDAAMAERATLANHKGEKA